MIQLLSAAILSTLPVSVSRDLISKSVYEAKCQCLSRKQLLVDISEVIKHDARSGIQRVVRGILPRLLINPPTGYVVCPVYSEKNKGYSYAPVTYSCLQADEVARKKNRPVVVQKGDIFLGLDLAAHLIPRHQTELLRWKRQGVRISFLVYDLLPLLHPEWFNSNRNKTFRRWMHTLAIYADNLICISKTGREELQQWLSTSYGLQERAIRLGFITLGSDIVATMPSKGITSEESAILAQLLSRKFVLMVGTLEPRKGYSQALGAFELLWQKGFEISLVIAGKSGWQTEALQQRLQAHSEYNNQLFWFETASDELLEELYKASLGVLITSEAEGFGLPLIEALFYGKPVLARGIKVFREVINNAITYFESDQPESLSMTIHAWVLHCQGHLPIRTMPTWSCTTSQLLLECGIGGSNFN